MRIDSHHHFIDYSEAEYPWIDDNHAAIRRSFFPEELKSVLDTHNMDGSVVVQARESLQETKWLIQLADQNDWIKGVVGWVDLCADDIEQQLQELVQLSPKFKGVRHVLQGESDDRFMLREDFRRGISKLAPLGLTYDILIFEKHLPYAIELVKQFPTTAFVIDHIAKPVIKEQSFAKWNEDIRKIAEYPNVCCKVSGMVTEAHWGQWKAADFAPYLEAVYAAFGADRLMFGSDWPVCTLSGTYSEVYQLVDTFIAQLPAEDQSKIMGETCVKFYGL
ncbi:amidohydrolase family protein [Paenibacillus yanchengensis]|uniref:Amidohydrolase family protein n=1 Tax=Paenibacillus yanchengensis TaxID=2035833 RepID=A0ABW4YRQ9_9BACL